MKLFELFATLGLDTGEFDKGVEGASEKGKGLGEKIDKAMGVAKKAIVAVGIGAALTGLKNDLLAAAAAGDKVDKASQQLGMSRKAYQEWGYVLAQNGADIDSMGASMKTLQNAMVQGTDATDAAFSALGLSVDAMKAKSPEEAFDAVVTALQGMPEGAEKTALAMDLLGKNALTLMPLLNQTAEGTDALKQQANDMGMVLTDDAVDASVEFGDALDMLKKSAAGVLTQGFTKLMPGITSFINKIAPLVATLLPKLIDAFGSILEAVWPLIEGGLDFLASALEWVADNIDWLLPILGALAAAFLVLNIVMNANPISLIIMGVAALVAGIVLLIQNFDAVQAWLAGIGAWVYSNVIEPVLAFFTELWTGVSDATAAAWDAIVAVWETVVTWFMDNIITPVTDFFTTLWEAISGAASAAWTFIVGIWTVVATWFNDNVIIKVAAFFSGLWAGIQTAASAVWDAIVLVWTAVSTWFKTNVTDKVAELFASLWSGIQTAAETVWNTISGWIQGIITAAETAISTLLQMIGLQESSGWESPEAQQQYENNSGGQSWEDVHNQFEGQPEATGLGYVPYDNFAARLHKGEAVLTSLEAANWRNGQGSGVDLSGLAQSIATAITAAMAGMQVSMDGETVGELVAPVVSAAINSAATAGRYRV